MDRSQKEKAVADFKDIFNEAEAIIVAHYEGINADSINDLRSKTRNLNVTFKVTKNRLVKLAIDNTPYKDLSDLFSGPTAIAYSNDVVAAAKVTKDFSKDNFISLKYNTSTELGRKYFDEYNSHLYSQ